VKAAERVGSLAILAAFLAWALAAAHVEVRTPITTSVPAITLPQPYASAPQRLHLPVSAVPGEDDTQPEAESETDLYGNSIDEAVAEYGLDAAGALYELHAPQVELPHLASPKS